MVLSSFPQYWAMSALPAPIMEKINKFIYPQIEDLNDPFLMNDMEIAVNKILETINNNEKITIYGDYDVDGITSIAVLYQLNKKTKIRESEKNRLRTATGAMLERAIAQVLDYKNILKEDNIEKEKLYNFLNNLVATNFAKSNSERNINIGE